MSRSMRVEGMLAGTNITDVILSDFWQMARMELLFAIEYGHPYLQSNAAQINPCT
jgi:hypothetical protein